MSNTHTSQTVELSLVSSYCHTDTKLTIKLLSEVIDKFFMSGQITQNCQGGLKDKSTQVFYENEWLVEFRRSVKQKYCVCVVLKNEQVCCGRRQRVDVAAFTVHPVFQLAERHAADADVTDTWPGGRASFNTLQVARCLRAHQPPAGDRLSGTPGRSAVVQLPVEAKVYLHLCRKQRTSLSQIQTRKALSIERMHPSRLLASQNCYY